MKNVVILIICLCMTGTTMLKSQSNQVSGGLIAANNVVLVATTPDKTPVNFYLKHENTEKYLQILPSEGDEWQFVCKPCKDKNCYQSYFIRNSNDECPQAPYELIGGRKYRIIKDEKGCFIIRWIR